MSDANRTRSEGNKAQCCSLHELVGRLTEALLNEENGLRRDTDASIRRGRADHAHVYETAAEVVGAVARALIAASKPPNVLMSRRENNH